MKVSVKSIEPNPYRNLKNYEIQKARVQALKNSINETGWWDNILLRPSSRSGNFQLAYGHHRLTALKELAIKEIDVPVKDLDDATMLKIMANENMADWKASPAVINETVFEVKRYLDEELGKCEKLENVPKILLTLTVSQDGEPKKYLSQVKEGYFDRMKRKGVGGLIVKSFLGDNWKQWMVQDALDILKEEQKEKEAAQAPKKKDTLSTFEPTSTVSRKAYETFDTQSKARKFKQAVRKYKVPKSQQEGLAKKIQREEAGIEETVYRHAKVSQPKKNTIDYQPPKTLPSIDSYVDKACDKIAVLQNDLNRIKDSLSYIESTAVETRFYGELDSLAKTIKSILQEK